jgi:hypothetical protein
VGLAFCIGAQASYGAQKKPAHLAAAGNLLALIR